MKTVRSLALAGLFAFVAARGSAQSITENFSADPLQNGWQLFGNTNLFQWTTNGDISVTWDSTQPNSYLCKPLGTVLTKDDDFTIEFDLQLTDAVAFNYGAPISVGLFQWDEATNALFSRGTGNSPDLCEFDFFPDTGFGDSIDATLKDAQGGYGGFYFAYDNLPLDPAKVYHVVLSHAAGTLTVGGQLLTNGQVYTALPLAYSGTLTNFHLDTISISSFQDDGFDSILAHGIVDNIAVTLPPPVRALAGGFNGVAWGTQFATYAGWSYRLQRTTDFQNWIDVAGPVVAGGSPLQLQDLNPPPDNAFYRIQADPPLPVD